MNSLSTKDFGKYKKVTNTNINNHFYINYIEMKKEVKRNGKFQKNLKFKIASNNEIIGLFECLDNKYNLFDVKCVSPTAEVLYINKFDFFLSLVNIECNYKILIDYLDDFRKKFILRLNELFALNKKKYNEKIGNTTNSLIRKVDSNFRVKKEKKQVEAEKKFNKEFQLQKFNK